MKSRSKCEISIDKFPDSGLFEFDAMAAAAAAVANR